jgi:hypothetical protein
MIYKDIDDLNARFWSTSLTYTGPDNTVFEIPDEQKLTENGKLQEVDASEPWVRWTIIRGASERDTLGSNPFFRSIGTATLEIHVPKGIGTGIANDSNRQSQQQGLSSNQRGTLLRISKARLTHE